MKAILKKRALGILAVSLAGVLSLIGLTTAQAAPTTTQAGENGVCEANELCLYYRVTSPSSMIDLGANVYDFRDKLFLSPGAGFNLNVYHNAETACNWKDSLYAHIFALPGTGNTGVEDVIPPHTCKTLYDTRNNNGSLIWLSTP